MADFRSPDRNLDDLIDPYFAGELDSETAARVRVYLESTPGRQGVVAGIRASVRGDLVGTAPDVRAGFESVKQMIEAEQHHSKHVHSIANRPHAVVLNRTPWATLGVVAAVVAVVATVFTLRSSHRTVSPAAETRYATVAGELKTVPLPDGNLVTLAPATTIRVTDGIVDVTGEAYFTIRSNAQTPFTVRTSNALARVLGTAFTVRRYPDESNSRIVVTNGKVALQRLGVATSSTDGAILTTRMMGVVNDSAIQVSSGVALEEYTGWTQGRLVFDHTPVRDVITELARAYAVEIRLTDSAMARVPISLTASIKTQPISTVLDLLALVVNAHVVRDGSRFVLAPGRTQPTQARPSHIPPMEAQYGR